MDSSSTTPKSGAYDSGYELSSTDRAGTSCLPTGPDGVEFDVEGAPDGTYVSDWVYTEGAGDLDECNGTTVDGQYIYLATDEYPFIGRCLNGEFTDAVPSGPPPLP